MQKLTKTDTIFLKNQTNPLFFPMMGHAKNCDEVQIFFDGIDSFCLLTKTDTCCFAGENFDFFDEILSTFNKPMRFCGMTDKMMDFLAKKHKFLWESRCFLYVHDQKPLDLDANLTILPMQEKYWQLVSDGTFYKAEKSDICECIKNRPSSAVYIDGKPVCWCLTHIENSLGMLFTLPEHRKKGFALAVMKDIVTKLLKQGTIPYAFIVVDNIASQKLAPKYGLQYLCPFSWCGIDFRETTCS